MTIQHPQVLIMQHALAQYHLTELRNTSTRPAAFRQHVRVLSMLLAAEVTRNFELETFRVTTPLEITDGYRLPGRVAAVPILRAGLGMVEPITDLIPELEVWHLGLYRDEATAEPVRYYDKLPTSHPPDIAIVLDPMLATGGSAALAVEALRRWEVPRILLMAIIAAPEGVRRLTSEYPELAIFTCALDRELNSQKYIVPGLGDAGDRIFNT